MKLVLDCIRGNYGRETKDTVCHPIVTCDSPSGSQDKEFQNSVIHVYTTLEDADGTIGNSECLFMVWSPWRWILTVPRCHSSGARGPGPQHCTHKHPQVGEIFNWHLDAARYLDLWFCGVESCGAELAQASCPCLLTLRPGEPFLRYPFRLEVLTSVALRRPLDHD